MPRPRKKRKPSLHDDEIPAPHMLVQTRISREAKDKIEKLAALEGLSMASWLRRLVILSLRTNEALPLPPGNYPPPAPVEDPIIPGFSPRSRRR